MIVIKKIEFGGLLEGLHISIGTEEMRVGRFLNYLEKLKHKIKIGPL